MVDINKIDTIDTQNALDANLSKLKHKKFGKQFDIIVDQCQEIGAVLRSIRSDNLIDKVNDVLTYYVEAINWLGGKANTANWVSIEPINPEGTNLEPTITQFMQGWLPNFYNLLRNNALFYSYYEQRGMGRENLRARVDAALAQSKDKYSQEISDFAKLQLDAITSAASLEEWQKYFDDLISPQNEKQIIKGTKQNKVGRWFDSYKDSSTSYFDLMNHYKKWKNLWLFAFFLSQLILICVERKLGWNISNNLAEILSLKISVAVLFGSLFVSSNKNYRIYANLYDQARLRSTIAKTVQGILLDDSRISPEHKAILLTVAAQSLFEMKPNGHLTKKETTGPLNEIITALVAKN